METAQEHTESLAGLPTPRGVELFKELYNRNGAAFTAFEEGFNIKPFLEACRWRMNLSEKDTEELNRAEDFLAEMIRKGRA